MPDVLVRIPNLSGTTSSRQSQTLQVGDVFTDIDTKRLVANDGQQKGGFPAPRFNETVVSFYNVVAMLGEPHTSFADGQLVHLAGYRAPGDHGGSMLRWHVASNAPVDNCQAFQPASVASGPGRFIRELTSGQWPCPEMAGGVADAVLKPQTANGEKWFSITDATDNTDAIERVLFAYGRCGLHGIYGLKRGLCLSPTLATESIDIVGLEPNAMLALMDAPGSIAPGNQPGVGRVVIPWWSTADTGGQHDAVIYYQNDVVNQITPTMPSRILLKGFEFYLNAVNRTTIYATQAVGGESAGAYISLASRAWSFWAEGVVVEEVTVSGAGPARGSKKWPNGNAFQPETFLGCVALPRRTNLYGDYATVTAPFAIDPPLGAAVTIAITDASWIHANDILWLQDYGRILVQTVNNPTSITVKAAYNPTGYCLHHSTPKTIEGGRCIIWPETARSYRYFAGHPFRNVRIKAPIAPQATSDWGGTVPGYKPEITALLVAGHGYSRNLFRNVVFENCELTDLLQWARGANDRQEREIHGFTPSSCENVTTRHCRANCVAGAACYLDAWIVRGWLIDNCNFDGVQEGFKFGMGMYAWDRGYYGDAADASAPSRLLPWACGPWWEDISIRDTIISGRVYNDLTVYWGSSLVSGNSKVPIPRWGNKADCRRFSMADCELVSAPGPFPLILKHCGGQDLADIAIYDNVVDFLYSNGIAPWPDQSLLAYGAGWRGVGRAIWRNNCTPDGTVLPLRHVSEQSGIAGQNWPHQLMYGQDCPAQDQREYTFGETADANGRAWLGDYHTWPNGYVPLWRRYRVTGTAVTKVVLPKVDAATPLQFVEYEGVEGVGPYVNHVPSGLEFEFVNLTGGAIQFEEHDPLAPANLIPAGTIATGETRRVRAVYGGPTDKTRYRVRE